MKKLLVTLTSLIILLTWFNGQAIYACLSPRPAPTPRPEPKPIMLEPAIFDQYLLEKEAQRAYDVSLMEAENRERKERQRQKEQLAKLPMPTDFETLRTFERIEKEFGIPWQYVFAICHEESSLGRNLGDSKPDQVMNSKQWRAFNKICRETGRNPHQERVSKSGDVGPMQFQPATWLEYKTDADGDGIADPWSLADSSAAAARYLGNYGFDRSPKGAVASYNGGNVRDKDAWEYSGRVMRLAKQVM